MTIIFSLEMQVATIASADFAMLACSHLRSDDKSRVTIAPPLLFLALGPPR